MEESDKKEKRKYKKGRSERSKNKGIKELVKGKEIRGKDRKKAIKIEAEKRGKGGERKVQV